MADLQFNPQIAPYVEAPNQEIDRSLSYLQGIYDQNLMEDQQQQNILSTFDTSTAPSAVALKNQYAKEVEQKFTDLAKKYKGDYTNRNFKMERAALSRKLAADPRLGVLAEAKKMNDFATQTRAQARVSGNNLLFDNNRPIGVAQDEDGNYMVEQFGGEKQLDYVGGARSIVGKLRAEGSTSMPQIKELLQGMSKTGVKYLATGQWQGVTEQRLVERVRQVADEWMLTPEGDQFIRLQEDRLGRKLTNDEKLRTAAKFMYDVSSDQVFDQTQYAYQFPSFLNQSSDSDATDSNLIGEVQDSFKDTVQEKFDVDKYKKRSRGRLSFTEGNTEGKQIIGGVRGGSIVFSDENDKEILYGFGEDGETLYGDFNEDEKRLNNTVSRAIFGKTVDNLTEKEQDELYTEVGQYLESLPDHISTTFEPIPSKLRNALDEDIDRIFTSSMIYDPATGELLNGTRMLEKLGVGDLKQAEKKIDVIGQYSAANPFSLMTGDDDFVNSFKIRIGGLGGKELVMSAPVGIQKQRGLPAIFANRMARAAQLGRPVTLKGINFRTNNGDKATINKDILITSTSSGWAAIDEDNTTIPLGTNKETIPYKLMQLIQ